MTKKAYKSSTYIMGLCSFVLLMLGLATVVYLSTNSMYQFGTNAYVSVPSYGVEQIKNNKDLNRVYSQLDNVKLDVIEQEVLGITY